MLGKLSWFGLTGLITIVLLSENVEEKSFFKMLGLTFSYNLDWASYIVSIAKTISMKIGALIRSMRCFSSEVALYKSTIQQFIEYCCRVWAGAPSCYLELLEKLKKANMQDRWSFTCCFS